MRGKADVFLGCNQIKVKMFLVVLCALFLGSLAISEKSCPRKVKNEIGATYLKVYGNWCYFFDVFERKSHGQARAKCQQLGGTLAMPKTQFINNFITRELVYTHFDFTRPVWIGLHDQQTEGKYMWDDGSIPYWKNFNYKAGMWFPHLENCIALDPASGKWDDFHCERDLLHVSARKPFVCQFTAETPVDEDQNDAVRVTEKTDQIGGNQDVLHKTYTDDTKVTRKPVDIVKLLKGDKVSDGKQGGDVGTLEDLDQWVDRNTSKDGDEIIGKDTGKNDDQDENNQKAYKDTPKIGDQVLDEDSSQENGQVADEDSPMNGDQEEDTTSKNEGDQNVDKTTPKTGVPDMKTEAPRDGEQDAYRDEETTRDPQTEIQHGGGDIDSSLCPPFDCPNLG